MRAVRLHRLNSEPALVEIPTPTPGPGEVLLKVDAAGLCHSDLHLMELPAGAALHAAVHARARDGRHGRGARRGGARRAARATASSCTARWGCGRCWACRSGHGEPLRGNRRRARRARRRSRLGRWPGRPHARAVRPLPGRDRRARRGARRASERRGADALSRDQARRPITCGPARPPLSSGSAVSATWRSSCCGR